MIRGVSYNSHGSRIVKKRVCPYPACIMSTILEIRNANVYRGRTQVFANLCLTINAGQHTAVLGPNGAGKTTLLKLLAREIYPRADSPGTVSLFGRSHWNVWELRSRLGMVSQDLQENYLGNATGLDVVLSGFRSSIGTYAHQRFTAEEHQRAEQMLQDVDACNLADKTFQTLSTGQRRRLLLARALVHDPEALLLDEPTSGLDIRACFHYLATIRKLMRQGRTVILVTHHIHEIPPEMRRVVLLKAGQVMADGDKKTVMTQDGMAELFDTPLRLLQAGGFYQVVPA
jgi:iron complex transport system ATP-binding protein